jgi:hypothetical protein
MISQVVLELENELHRLQATSESFPDAYDERWGIDHGMPFFPDEVPDDVSFEEWQTIERGEQERILHEHWRVYIRFQLRLIELRLASARARRAEQSRDPKRVYRSPSTAPRLVRSRPRARRRAQRRSPQCRSPLNGDLDEREEVCSGRASAFGYVEVLTSGPLRWWYQHRRLPYQPGRAD